jgi:hypothetical protein
LRRSGHSWFLVWISGCRWDGSQWPGCVWHNRGRYHSENLPDSLQRTFGNIPRTAILNCVGHRDQFRRLDLRNGPRSQAGQNIGRHAPPDRVHVAVAFPLLPMLQPLCGYALEGILDRYFLCGLLGLPLRRRVNACSQQLACLDVPFSG